jgi:hypothetical protein
MKSPVIPYFIQFALQTSILLFGAVIAKSSMRLINYDDNNTMHVVAIISSLIVYITTTYIILLVLTKGMRMFTTRLVNILTHKI